MDLVFGRVSSSPAEGARQSARRHQPIYLRILLLVLLKLVCSHHELQTVFFICITNHGKPNPNSKCQQFYARTNVNKNLFLAPFGQVLTEDSLTQQNLRAFPRLKFEQPATSQSCHPAMLGFWEAVYRLLWA